jgi:predicted acyltransferase
MNSTESGNIITHQSLKTKSERLLSLDIFRGVTMAGMILVNNPGYFSADYYAPVMHAKWNGWTPTDMIFPFFLFIVGVAMTFSFAKRIEQGASRTKLTNQVLKRALLLFLLGMILNAFLRPDLSSIRIMGILQRIALCYALSAVIYFNFKRKGQVIIASSILVLYFILMVFIPIPGQGVGNLETQGSSWAQYLDNILLKGHMQRPDFESKGVLSTFPCLVITMIGMFAGKYLRSEKGDYEKMTNLYFFGFSGLLIGLIWNVWFPINQSLWTSSLVVFSSGLALICFATCYYLADIRKITWWTKPFVIFGTNALAAYYLSTFLSRILDIIKLDQGNSSTISLKTFITNSFGFFTDPKDRMLTFAILYVLFWMAILAFFYKKRIFIKI